MQAVRFVSSVGMKSPIPLAKRNNYLTCLCNNIKDERHLSAVVENAQNVCQLFIRFDCLLGLFVQGLRAMISLKTIGLSLYGL